jgi:hypothetical protein
MAYFYLKLHQSSNKSARQINITPNDFFIHVNPSYLKKNKYNKLYAVKECVMFLATVNDFFLSLRHTLPYSLKTFSAANFIKKK